MAGVSYSPADVVSRAIIAMGLGADPTITPLGEWPVYVETEPSSPDEVVTVQNTQGRSHGRSMIDGVLLIHHGLQIRVRGTDDVSTYAQADAIGKGLDEEIDHMVVALDADTDYLIYTVMRTGGVLALGKDSPNSRRNICTINALVALRNLS